MIRRTPVRRCSKKQAKNLITYRLLRDAYLLTRPRCEAGPVLAAAQIGYVDCQGRSRDLHHVKGRGKHLCEPCSFMAVCRHCHTFIHDNPGQARSLGLRK